MSGISYSFFFLSFFKLNYEKKKWCLRNQEHQQGSNFIEALPEEVLVFGLATSSAQFQSRKSGGLSLLDSHMMIPFHGCLCDGQILKKWTPLAHKLVSTTHTNHPPPPLLAPGPLLYSPQSQPPLFELGVQNQGLRIPSLYRYIYILNNTPNIILSLS